MMNPAQWAQGAFQIPANATPDQIRRKREILAEMILGQGRPQYVGEGLADGVSKAFAGWQTGKVNKFEGDARRKANDAFTAMLGQTPAPTGPLSVLGMDPAWNGGQPFAEPGTPAPEQTPSTFGVQPGQVPSAAVPFEPSQPFGITAGTAPGAALSPEALVQGLVQRGLPQHVAEGFAMNAQDESGFNPGINEAAPTVPGSRGGFGLMQWTGPRRRQLEAFAAQRGASVADPNVQMDFLMTELQGPEKGAARSILAAPDAGSAGAAIVNDFLRPAEEHRARRVAEYTGGGAAAPSGPQAAMSGFQVPQAPAYSGPPVAALQAALANPWLDDASKQIAAQMLEQAQQAADPMRQLQMQQGQLGLRKTQMEIAQMGQPEPAKPTDDMREYEFARSQGYGGSFQDFMLEGRRAGATNVAVGGDAMPGLGKLSADYTYIMDPATGRPKLDANGLPIAAPVPGSPAAVEQAAAAGKATNALGAKAVSGNVIVDAAAKARALIGGGSTGVAGKIVAYNPQTDAAELYRQVDVLKSNATIESLTAMRAASPTGGALGSVTEKENAMLAAKLGALDPAAGPERFGAALDDYERTLLRVIHGPDVGDAIFKQTRVPAAAASAGGKQTLTREQFEALPEVQSIVGQGQTTMDAAWQAYQRKYGGKPAPVQLNGYTIEAVD